MKADKEGFMYPVVTEDTCIDCGMCVKVCPIVNECENKEPYQKSYGGYSKDERIINSCASGGYSFSPFAPDYRKSKTDFRPLKAHKVQPHQLP